MREGGFETLKNSKNRHLTVGRNTAAVARSGALPLPPHTHTHTHLSLCSSTTLARIAPRNAESAVARTNPHSLSLIPRLRVIPKKLPGAVCVSPRKQLSGHAHQHQFITVIQSVNILFEWYYCRARWYSRVCGTGDPANSPLFRYHTTCATRLTMSGAACTHLSRKL